MDGEDSAANMKWIEVLSFDGAGMPRFGGVFSFERDTVKRKSQSRFHIEYKKEASAFVNYDPDLKMILVDHLISDAMADAFDITIRREPVDLSALVNEVAEANRPSAINKQQRVAVSTPGHSDLTSCDADRIREAIDNLISNAIKYSPIGGKIDIVVDGDSDHIRISVSDEGAGLSPEDLDRLFGRFQRLSAKPTGGESSTGLGLSIVKRIVDMHGGEVTADSAGPGQGANFTIMLPVISEAQP